MLGFVCFGGSSFDALDTDEFVRHDGDGCAVDIERWLLDGIKKAIIGVMESSR